MASNPMHSLKRVVIQVSPRTVWVSGRRGLIDWLFGANYAPAGPSEPVAVSRAAHQRRRVIGGPATNVEQADYQIVPNRGTVKGQSSSGTIGRVILLNGNMYSFRYAGSLKAVASAIMTNSPNKAQIKKIVSIKGKAAHG